VQVVHLAALLSRLLMLHSSFLLARFPRGHRLCTFQCLCSPPQCVAEDLCGNSRECVVSLHTSLRRFGLFCCMCALLYNIQISVGGGSMI